MPEFNLVDASVKALLREFPGAIARLAHLPPLPDSIRFEDTAINLPERRADHVLVLGTGDPHRGAIYLEYQLRPNFSLIKEWEFKRSALRLRLDMPVVLLVLYLEKGDRSTFPEAYLEEVAGVSNEFRFQAVRLWEHADRIRSGELWELAPLLVLCEDNPSAATLRTECELIANSGAAPELQADLLALALRLGARDLPRSIVEAIFRETTPMAQGASIIDDWIAEGEARGEARGRIEGEVKGKAEGQLEEARRLVTSFLQARFGELPSSLLAWVSVVDAAACEALLLRAARAESLRELGW